jgi:oligo-1,6-glucosidase
MVDTSDTWTTIFLENHDQPRSISRFASDLPEYRELASKMLVLVLCSLTGTLFLYQGQEIGMIDAPESWPADTYQCGRSVNFFNDVRERSNDDPAVLEQAHRGLQRVARDHARVPMQWDTSANARFCPAGTKPWTPALDSFLEINVADQIGRKDSVLAFWRELLLLRKRHTQLFVYGSFQLIQQQNDLMMYTKHDPVGNAVSLTVANLSKTPLHWRRPPEFSLEKAHLLIGNMDKGLEDYLRPFEERIYLDI